ncbi:MAG: ergothioneine biosynthesis protein EgtB [Deltaproteobacteria bacterium]|nr:ergothioneine biosynthesis protein EgtB [Deltaproteobacteria bacterium]
MALPLMREFKQGTDELYAKFVTAWARSDAIFDIVGRTGMLAKPIVWRHPFIFYVGHLPAFSWNQICGGILEWKSFNRYFDELFCRGIDPDVDTGECHWHPDVPQEWPTLAETVVYRDKVRGAILESLEALPYCYSNQVMARGGRVFRMVLEHEYMHQETLLYMMQQLPLAEKQRPRAMSTYHYDAAAANRLVRIPAGRARLGARFEHLPFGWDNEFGEIFINVPEFGIDALPVTNGEFLEFVEAGGYRSESFWQPADWSWKNLERKTQPACWVRRNHSWFYRGMFDQWPLEQVASWPVYVSLAEARAYARWRGKRLPTEAEYQRAAFHGPDGRESRYPLGATTHPRRAAAILISITGRRCRWVRVLQVRAAGACKSSSATAGS